jgi:hypothetical protein
LRSHKPFTLLIHINQISLYWYILPSQLFLRPCHSELQRTNESYHLTKRGPQNHRNNYISMKQKQNINTKIGIDRIFHVRIHCRTLELHANKSHGD